MTEPIRNVFSQIAATPYAWPFDGRWSPSDTAFLMLGFQQGPIAALDAAPAFQTAMDLMDAATKSRVLVVVTRRGANPDDSAMARRRQTMGDAVPAHGSDDWALPSHLVLPEDALLIDHGGDNGFYHTGLEVELAARGVRNLLIAGLPTDGLVHATQRAANDMGFECLAVADACKGTDEPRHAAQLRITTFGNGLFGAVASAAAIRTALTQSSGDFA